jgi:hypothetical protein
MNKNRDLKYNIYSLKRLHGQLATVHKRTVGDVDYTSGEQTVTDDEFKVKRAIMLPVNYSIYQNYTAMANRYGADIQIGDRQVLIDRDDLSNDVVIGDYLTIAGKRYEIVDMFDLDNVAYNMLLRNTQNE